MEYQLTRIPDVVLRLKDKVFITADPESEDYLAYQEWCAAGNTPRPRPAVGARARIMPTTEQRLARAGLTPKELHNLIAPLISEQIEAETQNTSGQQPPE